MITLFGGGFSMPFKEMPEVFSKAKLGNKGYSLVYMANIVGLRVPPGFVIWSDADLKNQDFVETIQWLARLIRQDRCVSVRSSPCVSMPGMMDTKLNVGAIMPHVFEVFNSWNNRRAVFYRKMKKIPDSYGTAVVVQKMVDGSADERSCSGVIFTVNPNTGDPGIYGEAVAMGQGEDVVSGKGNALDIELVKAISHETEARRYLEMAVDHLTGLILWPQDIEFTVEKGVTWILQTRDAKLSERAKLRTMAQIIWRYPSDAAMHAINKRMDEEAITKAVIEGSKVLTIGSGNLVGKGQACTRGIAEGTVGSEILLVDRLDVKSIEEYRKYKGIISRASGTTSHAAVLIREMGIPCITGFQQELKDEKIVLFANRGEVYNGDPIFALSYDHDSVEAVLRNVHPNLAKEIRRKLLQTGY